jgi:hypothetical protein
LPEARRLAVVYLERAQDGLARASGLASQEDRLPNIVNLIRFVMCREGTLDAAQRTAEVIARAETLLLGAKRIDDANSGVTEGLVAQNHQYAEQFIGYAAEMWLIAASGVVASERRKALFDRFASDLHKRGVTSLEQIPGRYVAAAPALPEGQRAISTGEKEQMVRYIRRYFESITSDDPERMGEVKGLGREAGRVALDEAMSRLRGEGIAAIESVHMPALSRVPDILMLSCDAKDVYLLDIQDIDLGIVKTDGSGSTLQTGYSWAVKLDSSGRWILVRP